MPDRTLRIGGTEIGPGERVTLDLPVGSLYTQGEVHMPVRVVRGRKPGPTLFVSAAIHGDEINGVEIIRRLLRLQLLKRLRGTLIAVPVVNVYGFISHSRYLPDRRDLNRSFPGSEKGSLAARLAELFIREVADNSTHGIDLHTGAIHRSNLPQVRTQLSNPENRRLARSFEVPVVLDSELRDGSLRAAVSERDIPIVVYEGGEALRFDSVAIRAGLRGVVGAMYELGMLPASTRKRHYPHEPLVAQASTWVRAPESGVLRVRTRLGTHVQKGDLLGRIGDPFGSAEVEVRAHVSGIVIGQVNLPLVNEGDALFHIAQFRAGLPLAETMEAFQAVYSVPSGFDPTEGGT